MYLNLAVLVEIQVSAFILNSISYAEIAACRYVYAEISIASYSQLRALRNKYSTAPEAVVALQDDRHIGILSYVEARHIFHAEKRYIFKGECTRITVNNIDAYLVLKPRRTRYGKILVGNILAVNLDTVIILLDERTQIDPSGSS